MPRLREDLGWGRTSDGCLGLRLGEGCDSAVRFGLGLTAAGPGLLDPEGPGLGPGLGVAVELGFGAVRGLTERNSPGRMVSIEDE